MRKRLFLFLALCLGLSLPVVQAANDPVADPKAIVRSGDMRFTVLTPEMIRIEWSDKQQFEDRASFTVVNRRLPVPDYKTWEEDGFLHITTDKLHLQYRVGSFPGTFNPASSKNLKITFEMDGRTVTWYPWKEDPLNLKGTIRTLDGANGDNKMAEMEEGLLSRSGWYVIDETETRADGSISLMFEPRESGVDWVSQRRDPAAMDWYFMGYGRDYKKALYDYTRIAGKIPMPPMYAFGYWYSKYEEYTTEDYKNLALEMEENGLPQDVMVLDMDWHYSGSDKDGGKGGWTGWSWNKRLIPDPAGLLKWLHDRHLKATLNLHPAYGVASYEDGYQAFYDYLVEQGVDVEADSIIDPSNGTICWNLENEHFYHGLFEKVLRPHEDIGVDFWWLDWQQWLLANNEDKLSNTFWCNHVFYNDMKAKRQARPLIFHRWGGLGCHRYQVGFSGDSHASFGTLEFETYFTSTASNVGYGYWSHDIGGHYQSGDNDPELFLRWIQFAVFSPIVRTHSSKNANIERRMWKYENYPLMLEAVKLRYSMVPYIYTQARVAYDTGVSICRPLYYEWPDENEAYKHSDEYMFGDDILAAPIVKPADADGLSRKEVWLPEGTWYEVGSGEVLEGGRMYSRTFTQGDIPHYFREGAIIPYFPDLMHLKERPAHLILKFAPGAAGELEYYEDEGDNDNYESGKYTKTRVTAEVAGREGVYTIYPADGSFDGMPESRSYELQLLAVALPASVTLDGVDCPQGKAEEPGTWTYDAEHRTVHIRLPETPCAAKTVVRVSFTEGGTGVQPVTANQAYVVHAPATEEVRVAFSLPCGEVSARLVDASGREVSAWQYVDTQAFSVHLPQDASRGVYMLDLVYDGQRHVEKIVK